ncbi:MAG TPA: amidase domain-containing protein [Anaerolineales bacterium]|nr:amidase domain-containing protein [Anaerolineales bacterium]HMR99739.1 amidase domain-containing protein [Anaerolineales bacterium]HNQ93777.1 amidase domain-containing protein [Anaerolineales bacterium]HNS60504.1 amidase domain-containing protein [Anaerolineales bacterium]
MKQMIAIFKTTSLWTVFILLFSSNTGTISPAFLVQDPPTLTPTAASSPTLTSTPTNTATPTFTPTPLTGLTLASTTSGCTSGPYITCSASVVTTHTDPYRWDFDITYTYGDNRTNMGSNFTYKIKFNTGVYYSGVPIWWNMYPIANEVMPNRKIDIYYSGVSDLASMDYPSGAWTVPGQPIPYNDFTVVFSRTTTAPEKLVRTDKWHLTIATYPNVATPTNTPTQTPTSTPTATFTPTPATTSTPVNGYIYNRVAAVSYANTWAHEPRNTTYPLSNETGCNCNDCTNYISQVLHNGGYPLRTGNFDENSYYEWWYRDPSQYFVSYSTTWSAANWFNVYISLYPNEFDTMSTVTALQEGDFILLDLRNNDTNAPFPDGKPDHGRVVVGYGNTSVNQSDYTDGCGNNSAIPSSEYTLLVNQHCTDRWHVAWDYNIEDVPRWYIHVID